MNISLTLDQLLDTFERYNLDIWPMQIIAYVLGIIAVFLAIKRTKYSDRIIIGIVAFMWLWAGIGFYLLYFGPVYKPAYIFGTLTVMQAVLFLAGMFKPVISFGFRLNIFSVTGLLLIAYAMIGYPVIGYLIGHVHPQSPAFGLAPCPVTVFTFGLLLMSDRKVPLIYLVIPLLWALSGFMPVSIGILEDIGLIIAGILGTAMIIYRNGKILI
ncbi:MAG: DUF6064 family protein [Bacteroidota bacterium]